MQEIIHVCYAVSDKKGTYTKFAGASMCSIFEHTESHVTVHLLHDHTLSEDNRRYLMQLIRSYGQQILFHDLEKTYGKRLWELEEKLKWTEGKVKAGLSIATWYRLLIGEVLPEVERLIYLDADTIVNLDIRELWEEETGENGLAAVPDLVIQDNHYSKLVEAGQAEEARYFNAGVLLLDRQGLDGLEHILERGAAFLTECQVVDFLDQDVLNHFYGEKCRLLPDKYNTLVAREMGMRHENVERCLYHYANRLYALDSVNNFYRLFLEYLTKTPWCNADFLSNLARQLHQVTRSELLAFANRFAGMRRIAVGPEEEKERFSKMLMLRDNEEYISKRDFDERGIRLEEEDILIFFLKPEEFIPLKKRLEASGCREWVHFLNGHLLLARNPAQDAKILLES